MHDSSTFYLGYFSGSNTAAAGDETIYVHCKAFNAFQAGFTTIYCLRIPDPRKNLFDKNFILTRPEFNSFVCYTYPFFHFVTSKKKTRTPNKNLVLTSAGLFVRLAQIYTKCSGNAYVWYLTMTGLLRESSSPILAGNWQLYASILTPFVIDFRSGIISVTGKHFWPKLWCQKVGAQMVLAITGEFHALAETVHEKTTEIYRELNAATRSSKLGQTPNMLFYESISKYFPSVFDVISCAPNLLTDTILPEFHHELAYYDGKFKEEMKRTFKEKTVMTVCRDSSTLQCYAKTDQTRRQSPWMTTVELEKQIRDVLNVFKRHNMFRSVPTVQRSTRTAFYAKLRYLYSRTDPLDEFRPWPYPLYTPYVFTLRNNAFLATHILNIDELDRPFLESKRIVAHIRLFLQTPTAGQFMKYATAILDVIRREGYSYNEQLIANFPIYALSLDVDIKDVDFVRRYSSKERWLEKKLALRTSLVELMTATFEILNLNITEKNANFLLYESIPHQSSGGGGGGSSAAKIGLRFVIRSNHYVFRNTTVVSNIVKLANFLMSLDSKYPEPCLDESVYSVRGRFLRLPCTGKWRDDEIVLPLIPIMTRPIACFVPSAGLVHYRHRNLAKKVKVVEFVPNFEMISATKKVIPSSITSRMINNNFKITYFLDKDYSEAINRQIVPFLESMPLMRENGIVGGVLRATRKAKNEYNLGQRLIGICNKKRHLDPSRNPCSVYCFLKKTATDESIVANVFQYCFGSDCGASFLYSTALDG